MTGIIAGEGGAVKNLITDHINVCALPGGAPEICLRSGTRFDSLPLVRLQGLRDLVLHS